MSFNLYGTWAIYRFEMARAMRTLWQSLVTPVITTSLYFVVFGAAIGSNIEADATGGVPYGAFIVPGLMMLSLFTESIFNASFGIHMPRFTGTIYEILSAPLSAFETVLGYVGAAATKAMTVALVSGFTTIEEATFIGNATMTEDRLNAQAPEARYLVKAGSLELKPARIAAANADRHEQHVQKIHDDVSISRSLYVKSDA